MMEGGRGYGAFAMLCLFKCGILCVCVLSCVCVDKKILCIPLSTSLQLQKFAFWSSLCAHLASVCAFLCAH